MPHAECRQHAVRGEKQEKRLEVAFPSGPPDQSEA